VVAEAAVEPQLAQVAQVAQAQQEQFLSTIDIESLPYKMYAVLKNKIVIGYQWDNNPIDGLEFVLMTFENSPAYIGGEYKNGKFTRKEK
jgi:hypothetical protein